MGQNEMVQTVELKSVLTEVELEVLRHAALGMTDQQIAAATFKASKTVKFQMTAIYNKLGLSGKDCNKRVIAAKWAHDHGLV